VESYNTSIATNPKVEMILLSRDQTEDAATAWAEKVNMPWPTLMMEDTDNKFLEPYNIKFLPTYLLIDRTGKLVANGKSEVFAKIKETAN
jgi:hypothetical protein